MLTYGANALKPEKVHYRLNLHLFDANTQTTASTGLTAGMHTYYEDRLLDNAEPLLVHDQFADKYPIPANNGKTVEFRKYSPLPKALTALVEGVTPSGRSLQMSVLTAIIAQYGDYVTISDILDLTHCDPMLEQATSLLGSQAGRTLDTVTREVLTAGTNVMFAPKVSSGTETEVLLQADLDNTALLTLKLINKAAAKILSMNGQKIGKDFVGIIHPNISCDLMNSDKWLDIHKYAKPENIYEGEIGKIGGVRFVETTEAKIKAPAVISDGKNRLTCKTAISSSSTSLVIKEVLTAATPSTAIPVYINGVENTITAIATSNGVTTLTIGTAISSLSVGAMICGKGAGKDGSSVYCTMILGKSAYGVTDVQGGGLRSIIKQLGSAGTSDPLNQRATSAWKAIKVAERLVEEFMVRVEHCSDTERYADAN